jgi:hypothetical protein
MSVFYTLSSPAAHREFALTGVQTLLGLSSQVLNVIWFYKITTGLFKALFGEHKRASKARPKPE